MEQGLEQINRLRSNNAKLESRPAEQGGYADLIINNHKDHALYANVMYDDNGSKSTGVYNTTYKLGYDNLFKINDYIEFSKIKSTSSTTNIINLSIPFGYYTLNYADSQNQYIAYTAGGTKIDGTSTNHDIRLNRLLFRNKKHQLSLTSNLNFRNQTLKQADIATIPSQRLSTGRLGFDYIFRDKNLIISSSLTYSQGLTIHSAIDDKKDNNSLNKDTPRAQFEKYSYNLALYQAFNQYVNYSLQINGQYSPDSLYSSELIYIGGNKYTVRGLEVSGISGSKGAYARNQLSFNLPVITFDNKLLNKAFSIAGNISPYIFYDTGYSQAVTDIVADAKKQYISGAGIGVKYNSKYLNAQISYAKSLNAPDYVLADNSYNKSAIYFGISGSYFLF